MNYFDKKYVYNGRMVHVEDSAICCVVDC